MLTVAPVPTLTGKCIHAPLWNGWFRFTERVLDPSST
jgi:hypothetical protein